MHLTSLLLPLLPCTSALLIPRAGGPTATPLPPSCTPTSPTTNLTSQAPIGSFRKQHLLYQFHIPLPDATPIAERWQECLEQCNGLEGCVAAYMADGLRAPKNANGAQGEKGRGCLMFDAEMAEGDLGEVKGVRKAKAGNLGCEE
ncbi:Protein kinase rad3 [Sphaceloma murrayae]|uniref:Protein kinase rad3 n=1 Tax=Sphaceloma murrayae TaxID=2082308 RepID=A0A2K1QMQ4_9PEZI|nr:Protein kinase rad3 [Sphaceloma murrayae]